MSETRGGGGSDPKALMDSMRGVLEADEAEGKLAGLTVDDLQSAMSHPSELAA